MKDIYIIFFSHMLQKKYNFFNLTSEKGIIELHPEWPTYKKQTKLEYGLYKNVNGLYKPNKNGSKGLIDFTIGKYDKPDIGIEFSLKYGWANEEVVFDFLKLLDKKNPFKVGISLNIIFREKSLVKGGFLIDLENHINEAYCEAIRRLNSYICEDSRELYFFVTEIDNKNNRRHWYFEKLNKKFIEGLPIIVNKTKN